MYVTTFNDPDNQNGTYIRLNASLAGALAEATKDTEDDIANFTYSAGTFEADVVEGEGDEPTVVRIINPHNGHEYQAYIIEQFAVGG